MTIYYVRPGVGNDTNGGTNWATDSWATLKKATDTVAAGDNQIVMDTANADVLSADTTYTVAAGVQIISSANGTSYTAGATVSSTTSGVDVTINGTCTWVGINITLGDGTDTNTILLGQAGDSQQVFDRCNITFGGSGGSYIQAGAISAGLYSTFVFSGCAFTWGNTGSGLRVRQPCRFINCDMSAGSTHPTSLINTHLIADVVFTGCDLSDIATVIASGTTGYAVNGVLSQCKLKASATIFSSTQHGEGEVYVYDCDDGDSHIELAHYNYYGSTTISTSVYANDNIADSNLSWKVEGTANASKATPYLSPLIPVYHSGTSAITPYLEVLRSGSTTSYLESEAWIDVLAKVTSGSTKSTLYTNRANPLDTTADNTDSAKGAGDWTGEDASNNWYGKLILNAAITPAEAGHILARVGLAGQYTLYVDPQIRGLA